MSYSQLGYIINSINIVRKLSDMFTSLNMRREKVLFGWDIGYIVIIYVIVVF